MEKYQKGDIVRGQVTGIQPYGIFIKIDALYSGLIHISEISPNFVRNINDYVKVGEKIFCKIIAKESIKTRFKLSIKEVEYKTNGKLPPIVESKNGFNPLRSKLPEWTQEKLTEIKPK